MTVYDEFKSFELTPASLTLWVFKKYIKQGKPTFTSYWIDTSPALATEIKNLIESFRDGVHEVMEYSILAQNNESSLLTITSVETYAPDIVQSSANEIKEKKVTRITRLDNKDFYSVKLVHDGVVLHCIKKTDESWKTKKMAEKITMLFSDQKLDIDKEKKFTISKYFDFFIFKGNIFIENKKNFESVLSYKKDHIENLEELLIDKDFSNLFDNAEPLKKYVGNRAIQLRRVSAIKTKGNYKNKDFMDSLRENAVEFKLNIKFDKDGKIIVDEASCPDIFNALLDHRLQSHYRKHLYDVQNGAQIQA
ncbi:TPA: Kiwa anti-phage protein KwaB-like domain-containing protein [Yersinia enterocolitica]|nr:DUF4868 domain-containing protein [Yersinia enterocolitica]HEN3491005.1 DUF4868 domain-containing protein [Yersinia enterocolitica]